MAGGTANKSQALLQTAIAKMVAAIKELQELQQSGNPALHGKHAVALTQVNAAITALNALL